MSNEDDSLVREFATEALETLVLWEEACLALDKEVSIDELQKIFRYAHNLKGTSRAVGLKRFGDFVHQVEDLLSLLKVQPHLLNAAHVELLLAVQAVLSYWLQNVIKNPEGPQIDSLKENIKITIKSLQSGEEEDEEAVTKRLGEILLETNQITAEQLEEALRLQDRKIGELLVDQGFIEESELEKALKAQKSLGGPASSETFRVASRSIDELIQLIGELTVQQAILNYGLESQQTDSPRFREAINISNRLSKELQGFALSLRMQPLESLFQRLERVARDVARSQQKKIEVEKKGGEVQLDKAIIDRITDSLTHVMRNSVDHGIESVRDRKAKKKSEKGCITIEAKQEAGSILIEVSDDGKGIDPDKIREKAIQQGLVSSELELTDHQVLQLIFLPGFSTASQVTEFSGRGVGMDVVNSTVRGMGGDVQVRSDKGKGSKMTLRLPTSLSVVESLIVSVSNIKYAVPMQELVEIVDLKEFPPRQVAGAEEVIEFRDNTVPVQRLNRILPTVKNEELAFPEMLGQRFGGRRHRGMPALLVTSSGELTAFAVDSIWGQQQIFVRPLAGHIVGVPGLSGTTVLNNGEPGLILNLPSLAKLIQQSELQGMAL